MKLLFDQNISHRLVSKLSTTFSCSQVRLEKIENYSDFDIWKYAKENNFTIVTFDADFYDISTLNGHPPKIIWLRLGNTSTSNLAKVFFVRKEEITQFITDKKYKEINCLEILEN